MPTTKGSKKLGAGAEAELRAKARKAKGTSSKGLDARPLGRNIATRIGRGHGAIINALGGTALTGAGLIGKAIGHKSAEDDLTRGRGAFKDVGRFAKAAIMGEPKDGKDGPFTRELGNNFYFRGSDKNWEKKEAKKKAAGGSTKKYAKGGSVSKRADGCATKGKTKGRFV